MGDAGARAAGSPDYASFAADSQQAFWDEEWLVTANSNRMGYRLAGVELVRERPAELLSHAVLPGTIQVPPNGQPIVLMHGAQTTGGYPKIGTVIRADLWKLAQARLNLPIRFVRTTPTPRALRWPRNVRICGRSTWRSTCAKRAAAPSRARRDNGGSGTERQSQ